MIFGQIVKVFSNMRHDNTVYFCTTGMYHGVVMVYFEVLSNMNINGNMVYIKESTIVSGVISVLWYSRDTDYDKIWHRHCFTVNKMIVALGPVFYIHNCVIVLSSQTMPVVFFPVKGHCNLKNSEKRKSDDFFSPQHLMNKCIYHD